MNLPSMRVEDKIALVTGTGSGLGRAIAIGLAHAGADVVLTELPERLKNAEETAREDHPSIVRRVLSRSGRGRGAGACHRPS